MKERTTRSPTDKEVAAELGRAKPVWDQMMASITESVGPVDTEWKISKSSFGRLCLLRQKKRTLLYLTPEKGGITVAIVLGERAVGLALESKLPESIKALIREARQYAEGRGIRFRIDAEADVVVVKELVKIKTTPK